MFYKTDMDDLSPALMAARLGAAIRTARLARGHTQGALAELLGVRRQTVADLENGRNVGLHVALGALAALGMDNLPAPPPAAGPDARAGHTGRGAPGAPGWPSNWSVVGNWDEFENSARERLEALMRRADSAETNRREAFALAPLNVRSARMIACPEFGETSEF